MKSKIILVLLSLAAILSLVACGPKYTKSSENVTLIAGDIQDTLLTAVWIKSTDIDTIVQLDKGKFSIEIPNNKSEYAKLVTQKFSTSIIPDGSIIELKYDGKELVMEVDKEGSENLLLFDLDKKLNENRLKNIAVRIRMSQLGVGGDSPQADTIRILNAEVDSLCRLFVSENIDKFAAVPVIVEDRIFSTEEMLGLIEQLNEDARQNSFIQAIIRTQKAKEATSEGKMFVDFTIPDSDGKTVNFSDYVGKGKYLLVDFWASWCGPCRRELPYIKDVYKKYKGKKFDVLGVAVWDKPEDTKKASEELGITWNEIINAQAIATDAYGIEGIPCIILFGPDGTIVKRGLRGAGIEEAVKSALRRK